MTWDVKTVKRAPTVQPAGQGINTCPTGNTNNNTTVYPLGGTVLMSATVLIAVTVKFWFVIVPVIGVIITIAVITNAIQKQQAIRRAATEARWQLASLSVTLPDDSLHVRSDKEVLAISRSPGSYRGLIVPRAALDKKAQSAADRASRAIAAISASPEYQAGTCGSIPAEALLRHRWEIAVALRDITERRAELPRSDIGPITAPVVAAQEQAITMAENATLARIKAVGKLRGPGRQGRQRPPGLDRRADPQPEQRRIPRPDSTDRRR